ncbi:MAG: radical SAM protein [Deltaproteobacteria bacterium]|nr:radical SAM protein [Deltaproteobacteria bacterium]
MAGAYLRLAQDNTLMKRVRTAISLMGSCRLCPRECGVDRLNGELGFCQTGRNAIVASFNAHFGEEPPLVGRYGSGTIFISSCNLLCGFCQNFEISHLKEGMEVYPEQMATMMIQLQERGCHNINFVTPTHVVPQILEALVIAIDNGLHIPLVYNSGGYDKKETLEILDGIFDIYMPDFKFWDKYWSQKYCQAPDYREIAIQAIKEMHRQVGDLALNDQGLAVRGVLIRHLVMPNNIAGTGDILSFLSKEISSNSYVNIMDQYRPCGNVLEDKMINRRLQAHEYREALATAGSAGLQRLDKRDRVRFIFEK